MTVTLDAAREARIGLSEGVMCSDKSVAQIDAVLEAAQGRGLTLLLTRLDADKQRQLSQPLDYDPLSRTGFFGPPRPLVERVDVAVVTAGTSDEPVAAEATRTLRFFGRPTRRIADVGVAGLWRLLDRTDELARFPIVIAIAGMDGALISVLGGLVGGVIIAVPTATGYGAARGGATALNAALTSCAPGVLVCNIGNGYGAASAALRILGNFSPTARGGA